MTEDRTILDAYRLALVVNAVKRDERYGGGHFDTAHWGVKTREAFHRAEEDGYIRGAFTGFGRRWSYEVTDAGRDWLDALGVGGIDVGLGATSPGDRALWSWLLLHGGVVSAYGTFPEVTDDDYLHLISCGVDYDRSGSVRDDSWTTFAGTFADDDRHTGVGAYATCLCDEVEDLHVVATIESVTALLRQMIA